jgi:hypothetical protein
MKQKSARRLNQAVFVCLTDRVAATTPFALAEGDFPNPADGKVPN